jgi:TRAP-type mannitol/chloroaromatic compound transport system permease small subunit
MLFNRSTKISVPGNELDSQDPQPSGNSAGGNRLQVLAMLVRGISAINWLVGQILSWLALACVLVCFTVVVQRYFFNTSTLWVQDLYVWVSGAMFTGVAGFALLRDDHVRVDIFYRPASVRWKAAADVFGVVFFLLPFMYVVLAYTYPAVARSWGYHEGSSNIGGMPGLFILKSFVIVFAVLVGLQGIAMALRSILVLTNNENLLPPDLRYGANDVKEAH